MLAGKRALEFETEVEEIVHGQFHAGPFLLVALVAENAGMEVAVAGMAEGGDGHVTVLGDLFQARDHGRNLGARHGDVFHHEGGFGAGKGRNGHAAGFPDVLFLFGVLGHDHFGGAAFLEHLFHNGGVVLDLGGVTVHFHQQHGAGVAGQAGFHIVFNVVDRGVVKEFQRAGHHMGRDDPGDGL